MYLQPQEIFIACAIVLVLVGPCLGSFSSAVAYRVPRGLSWVSEGRGADGAIRPTRSACPHCGYQLKFFDLIPILSWIFLRGRCRECHAPVSGIYPLLELTALVCAEAFLWSLGPGWELVPVLAMLPFVLAQFVIICQAPAGDEISSLSPQLLALISGAAILFIVLADGPASLHVAGSLLMVLIAGVFLLFRKLQRRGPPPGSSARLVTLFAAMGAFLGVGLVPGFLIAAGVLGMLIAAFRIARQMPVRDGLMLAMLPAFPLILAAGPQILALLTSINQVK